MAETYEKVSDVEFNEINTSPKVTRFNVVALKNQRAFLVGKAQELQAMIDKIDARLLAAESIGIDTNDRIIAKPV